LFIGFLINYLLFH